MMPHGPALYVHGLMMMIVLISLILIRTYRDSQYVQCIHTTVLA